ncbi:MAG: hypothetical protein K6T63_10105 [Alicyclobacillus herbarius]|uniref:putative amidoligase domain-containing protein n=1 Tax=Alicyclobacillus herbarius TaxID=122960 RepID=UPI0023564321|nr:hypothetical protein [Alicyclobacillus herbarius]MCL6632974.1 hypothetical protein [Alicyclobacillus herbarius]
MACYLLHAGQPSAKRLLRRVSALQAYSSASAVGTKDVVLRWGPTRESDPPQGRILNSARAVARTRSRVAMGRFLRRVGIRAARDRTRGEEEERFQRQFRIPVFHLTPLACFRSDAGSAWINERIQRIQENFVEVPPDEDRLTRRAVRLAMRAVHALGLDFGLVSIGQTGKGLLSVLDITPNPVLTGRMLELFEKAVTDYIAEETRAPEVYSGVLLGTDMELMLRNSAGKMVLASKYFGRRGPIGCDDRSIHMDGRRLPLLELRPEPDTNPLVVVNRLRDLMTEAALTINRRGVQWRAGSMPFRPFCTGGHIHFSNVPLTGHFVRVLDNYLGLPLMLVENPETAVLRRPRYGFLGDVRHKSWGFEYRTPSSFLVDRDVATAAMCLACVLAAHHRDLPVVDLYDIHLQTAFYRADQAALRQIALRNLGNLGGLAVFERFRDYIMPLVEMIEQGRTWDETVDVRVVWDIPLAKVETGRRKTVRRSQSLVASHPVRG